MDNLKQVVALTSLNDMMRKGYMSICVIDSVGEMLGINPKCEAYSILRPLHCVNFDKMPKELAATIPGLIQQCLSVEPTFQFMTLDEPPMIEAEAEKKGILRQIFGGA